jgi:alpha-tubulin suppressor-like RCC1 family protein
MISQMDDMQQQIDEEEEESAPFNEVYVWGDDSSGQLGLCGLFPEKQQVHLSPKICSFNVIIKSIACGFKHTLFVSESGHVYSMGSNSHGQLGIGDNMVKTKNTPTLVES